MKTLRTLSHAVLAGLATLALPSAATATPTESGLRPVVAAMHEHSGYSDGWPGSRPVDYFASGRTHGLDAMVSSEHAEDLKSPNVFNEECLDPTSGHVPECANADPVNPLDAFRKWDAIAEHAAAATDADYTAGRGFEWSSDRFGHMNVYFSKNMTDSNSVGGTADLGEFYAWLQRPAALGGGADGLVTFNHPGGKSACGQIPGDLCAPGDDSAFNWNDFEYVDALDPRMVGIEVFNGGSDYGSPGSHESGPDGWYVHALDRGWHVGAIGAEDKGHDRTDDWGAAQYAKTVFLAPSRSLADIRQAMSARRFYAVLDNALRLSFGVNGEPMGTRLGVAPGEDVRIVASASGGDPVTLDLVTKAGRVLRSSDTGQLQTRRPFDAVGEPYVFVRARRGDRTVGYTSPIWLEPGPPRRPLLAHGLQEFVGGMHGHSAYSDGYTGSRPADAYANAKANGTDFFAMSDHSDTLDVPISASQYCIEPAEYPAIAPSCVLADQVHLEDSFRKYAATREQAEAASTPSFTGIAGFEWTSDRFGHINVYFSGAAVNAKADGGYATTQALYGWLKRPSSLGGGSDGLATFNHPGDKKLSTSDTAYNWNDFAYDPSVDDQMVGIEVYNSGSEFGSAAQHGAGDDGWYAHALDKGWHVGAVGAEDLGHDRGDDWGGPGQAKTVVVASSGARESLRAAMRRRHFYAVKRPGWHLDYTVDGVPMGSRLVRPDGARLEIRASASGPQAELAGGHQVVLDLVTSGGKVVASSEPDRPLRVDRDATADERWYFVRARRTGGTQEEAVAYSSPVWVQPGGVAGEWLAGDLHAHSCYSHDVYCGPSDEPLEYEPSETAEGLSHDAEHVDEVASDLASGLGDDGSQAVTYGLDIGSRFTEASVRGLDWLAITDHERTDSASDGGFGAGGVFGLSAYENSIDGHAQMLGATHPYDKRDVPAMMDELHADGGLLQANHPGYKVTSAFVDCNDPAQRHWRYGYDVQPDTLEVWNPTSPIDSAEAYLECWLGRGKRMTVTGGSDSHWASLAAAGAGIGSPTTFVFARQRTRDSVLDALREGRTAVSKRPPNQGGAPLLLQADADGDGTFEAMTGDTVPPGSAMRVRSADPAGTGYVKVRANGQSLVLADDRLLPGGSVEFTAPATRGWVRADLLALPESAVGQAPCPGRGQAVSTCTYDQLMQAMTSPVYLRGRPSVRIASGPEGPTAGKSPTFTFETADAVGVSCALDEATPQPCTSPVTYADLSEGEHVFRVRAQDEDGGSSDAATRAFTVDTSAPQTAIVSGPPARSTSTDARFVLASEQGAAFECRLDGAAYAPCTSPAEVSVLTVGAHVFEARARDGLGNVDATPARWEFEVTPASGGETGNGTGATEQSRPVTTTDDTGSPPPPPPSAEPNPTSGTSLAPGSRSPAILRLGVTLRPGRASLLRFTLDQPARIKVRVRRLVPNPARTIDTLRLPGRRGDNVVRLPAGTVRRLRPGRYELIAAATSADGRTGARVTRRFAVRVRGR